jgi:hypothetical protein
MLKHHDGGACCDAIQFIVYATEIERLYFGLIVHHKQQFYATLQLYLKLRIIVRAQKDH